MNIGYVSATWPPGKKKRNVPRIICHTKEKPRYSECNLPPITKLKSLMRRISHQWAGGKVHSLDIGFARIKLRWIIIANKNYVLSLVWSIDGFYCSRFVHVWFILYFTLQSYTHVFQKHLQFSTWKLDHTYVLCENIVKAKFIRLFFNIAMLYNRIIQLAIYVSIAIHTLDSQYTHIEHTQHSLLSIVLCERSLAVK